MVKSMNSTDGKGKKRIFILLGMVMMLCYFAIFGVIWLLMTTSSQELRQVMMTGFAALFVCTFLLMGAGLTFLVIGLLRRSASPVVQKIGRNIVDFFYPMTMWVGRLFGVSKEEIEDSYIKINNQMTVSQDRKYRPEEILILAPHCLQNTNCPHKITIDVQNCHRCGKCSVAGLIDIAEETGVNLVVASGGTFARKLAKEYQPKAIVAIACERDLTSGIKDMNAQHIPVVGVLNERPNGPCYNTTVQICKVRQALAEFIE
ncbi:MAG: DUF116 domain-containing protein [Peptococcaceae bacterium]|nr:DUF116 domain-containing protein [Peptococcaceae bacterium]